jgi:hypothetical protein
MFEELMGAYGGRLVVAVLGVGLALFCLIGILWIVRGRRGPSPFVRGGRNRQPRLQVLDAAAVDTRRRLVLVRRDDVEHLIMIGGPTDIVVESRISPAVRPADARLPEAHSSAAAALPSSVAAAAALPAASPATKPVGGETAKLPPQPAAQRPEQTREPAREPASEATREPPREAPVREMRPPAAAPASPPQAPVVPVPAVGVAPARAEPTIAETAASRETAAPIAHNTPNSPALDDAARLLETARDRVFAEKTTPVAPPARPAAPAGEHAKALGSDFEKILEQEMASNLAARDVALIARPNRPLPQNGPAVQVPGQTRSEPALQTEVARIFGEMSASRDK